MTLKGMKSSLYPAQDLRRRTMAWAIKLRVNPRVVRLQDMRRKWGSCTTAGTVTLAMDLLCQAGEFQDYVIVHELLHLRYPAHGRLFKACLGAHVPRWRDIAATAEAQPPGAAPRAQRAPQTASRPMPAQQRHRAAEGHKRPGASR
jgi:predicted metal-dependent hydrolase